MFEIISPLKESEPQFGKFIQSSSSGALRVYNPVMPVVKHWRKNTMCQKRNKFMPKRERKVKKKNLPRILGQKKCVTITTEAR